MFFIICHSKNATFIVCKKKDYAQTVICHFRYKSRKFVHDGLYKNYNRCMKLSIHKLYQGYLQIL